MKKLIRKLARSVLRRLEMPVEKYHRLIYNNPESLRRSIRKGDVVLVEGSTRMSQIIKLFSQSHWSHIAMYVGDELVKTGHPGREEYLAEFGVDAQHLLVEAHAGQGVVAVPLEKYIDYNIRVCRPFDIKKRDLMEVVRQIVDNLGKQYDEKNILDIAKMLLPGWLLPFGRRRYRVTDRIGSGNDLQVICSSMIARAFQSVCYPVVPELSESKGSDQVNTESPYGATLIMRHHSQILPRDFDLSPNFEIIKFNIIAGGKFNYKSLHWETDGGNLSPKTARASE